MEKPSVLSEVSADGSCSQREIPGLRRSHLCDGSVTSYSGARGLVAPQRMQPRTLAEACRGKQKTGCKHTQTCPSLPKPPCSARGDQMSAGQTVTCTSVLQGHGAPPPGKCRTRAESTGWLFAPLASLCTASAREGARPSPSAMLASPWGLSKSLALGKDHSPSPSQLPHKGRWELSPNCPKTPNPPP